MLHDLYLLSCYFEPGQAELLADDLGLRYGSEALRDAVETGWSSFTAHLALPPAMGPAACYAAFPPSAAPAPRRCRHSLDWPCTNSAKLARIVTGSYFISARSKDRS